MSGVFRDENGKVKWPMGNGYIHMLSVDVSAWRKVWCVLGRKNVSGSGSQGQASGRGGKKVNQAWFPR